MMALPRPVPPTCSIASEVVSVNSSIFDRVPGPTLSEVIEATTSAYATGTTRLMAALWCEPRRAALRLWASAPVGVEYNDDPRRNLSFRRIE